MGLFDNLKKKKDAKALGLSVEQYDQYLVAQSMNITLEAFKRYLTSFSGKYSLEQFAQYLVLEDNGHTVAQCERYFAELSGKVSVADYTDFLAAEQLGLSVAEYAAYAASLKGTMSAVDYYGFLQAQKIGLTMGKYLKYLKTFKGEMTIEEYDTYLKAEEHGMDQERYMEYLQKYKDQYSIERYLEFDKARSLGMTLEEYDLRLEASKQGMSLEDYKDHLAAKDMGISAEEYATYKEISKADCISGGIFTIPEKYCALPKNVFRHFSFSSVVFPDGITEIADEAFAGCSDLAEISIPDTVHTIGDEAFRDCVALTSLTIPGTVKKVGYHSFQGCSSLQTLLFEEGVEDIDISDWVELPALTKVVTPSTASLQHLSPYRERDARFGIINKDMRLHMSNEAKVEYIFAAQYAEYGLTEHQSEIEYLEVYGDFVFLELADFPNLKTVIFSAKGRIESVNNCPSLQMIYYPEYMEEVTQESILVFRGLRPAQATLSLRDLDAPALRFLAVKNGARKVDFAHHSEEDFTWVHMPVVAAEVEQLVEAPVEEPETPVIIATEEAESVPFAPNEEVEDAEDVAAAQTIAIAQQFSLNIPCEYIYSTDTSVIGENRVLIAMLDDAVANFQDPYSATESITILNGQPVSSVQEADAIASAIGLSDAQILIDATNLNVRYSVSESTDELTIVLALICTSNKSYPTQFFFNGSSNDAVAAVQNILLTITAERSDDNSNDVVKEPEAVVISAPAPTTVEVKSPTKEVPGNETYILGNEPPKLRERVERFFEKLHGAYPDKVIIGLDKDHKHWAETATILYRELGYESKRDFFAAYGFSVGVSDNKGGRPKKDHMAIVEELKRRYADGPVYATILELKAANPDLAPRFQNLMNQANTFFGMPLAKYFAQEGILVAKPDTAAALEESYDEEFAKLKSRFAQEPYAGTFSELKAATPDINWSIISKYHTGTTAELKDILVEQGILINQEVLARTRLTEVMAELKKRYPAGKPFPGTLEKLKAENSDLPIGDMNGWTRLIHNLSTSEYLTQEGILTTAKSVEDKLAAVTETLRERYASGEKKAYTLTDLREQNLDLPISTIGTWSKKVFGQNASEYLTAQGILSEYDWMASMRIENERREAAAKAREEKRQAELNNPVVATYYEPQVYYVEEVSVSGTEAEEWKLAEYWSSNPGEIFIEDYLGTKDHIIIPIEINGKKVSGLASFGFKTCKARTVEIPGYYKKISHGFAFQNQNITSAIIGEGVEIIEDSVFFNTPNLENVRVSKSVGMVLGNCAFKSTKWCEAQGDYVIVGTVLLYFNGDGAVVNVPNGITTVAELVAVFRDVRKVILPETVTTLCKSAFSGRGNENIQEFVFTDSLVNIGNSAFGMNKWLDSFGDQPVIINGQLYKCKATESTVVVPDGITKICAEVFKDNTTIKKVVLPTTLKSIDEQAFAGCQNLQELVLPEGLEKLGLACFYRCNKLTKISLPDSLIEIGRSAFNSCAALTEIQIGGQTRIIGEKAFLECTRLQTVHMSDAVTSIGTEAFSKCSSLKTITLSENLVEIGNYAFNGCVSLETIQIPDKVTAIGASAFYGCKSLQTALVPGGVEAFADSAFCGCEKLQEINIPKVLGRQALAGCKSLTKVALPEGLETISASCFANCSALKEVILPSTLKKIEDNAFCECASLAAVVLPMGLKELGAAAFSGCSSIVEVTIPETVNVIKDNAFKNCTSLADVKMPGTVSEFGIDVFTNSPYMKKEFGEYVIMGGLLSKYLGTDTEVVIPDNVTTIGENAFAEARHVETIIIPDSVTAIGKKIMGNVYTWNDEPKPQLKKLVIGNGVSEIGEEAFSDCEKLAEITFGKGLKEIGTKAFAGCTGLTAIDLSSTAITEVKQEAFRGCYNVKKLVLPEAVEFIDRDAFGGIYVGKISLPKSVRKVERSSFSGASELVVYDNIDPDAMEATEWQHDRWNGSVNSALACAMLGVPQAYVECQGNTSWRGYHITVLSTQTGNVRYRIYCDCEEREDYRVIMFSGWGKHASFTFEAYDDYFMRTRNALGRTEMAFCRIEYPEGLSAKHRANYEAFLERCLFIERSAKRTAELIARTDAVERLKILHQYRAIDEHNIGWIREQLEAKQATNCLQFLNETFSK